MNDTIKTSDPAKSGSVSSDIINDLSHLCGSHFWNSKDAWEAQVPEFGLCIERTVLVWVPCLTFWLFLPFHILALRRENLRHIPWTVLTYSKMVMSLLIGIAALTELVWAAVIPRNYTVPPNDFLAPSVLFVSYILQIVALVVGRRCGEVSSGLIWVFWLLMVLCGVPQLMTTIMSAVYQEGPLISTMLVVTFLVQYLGAIALFTANCFADNPPKLLWADKSKKVFPERYSSFINKVTYHWASGLVWCGWRRPLIHSDLWSPPDHCTTAAVDANWSSAWQREVSSIRKKKLSSSIKNSRAGDYGSTKQKDIPRVSVVRVMIRSCFWPYIFATTIYVISELLIFLTPELLDLLMSFTMNENEPVWHGYFYSILLLLVSLFTTVLKNIFFYRDQIIAGQLRSSLMAAVYRKALLLSASSRRERTLGEIVNLMAVDAQRMGDTILFLNLAWGAPIVIAVALYALWQILGPSVLAGLAVLILLIPINSVIANKIRALQAAQMKFKDKRIKMVNEIIAGIKVLKLYAWEDSFAQQVEEIRAKEIEVLRKSAYLQAFTSFIWLTTPYLVSLASFATYIMASDNILDAKTAFVSIALFNIMRMPITQLPNLIAQLIQAKVALKRMSDFLASPNVDPDAVTTDKKEAAAIAIRGGQFSWDVEEEESTWHLQDVELEVQHGKLVAVVGSVGAGKSSLISAMLGDMKKEAGRVVVNGRIAYVSQQAWLQNATLKDNILWGKPFDEARYGKVVDACSLQQDLDMLPGGDMTEVGEKGINLSGGQKQRISLARAAYSDADIILLDDPLSAVDSHVGRHIFDNLIGPEGMMKKKTRILVTHAVSFLPRVDEVIVIQDGKLVERGTYTQLLSKGGDFAQFLLQHINSKESDEEDADDIDQLCDQLEETPGGQVLLRQLSLKSSRVEEVRRGSIRRRRRESSCGSGQRRSESDGESALPSPRKHLQSISSSVDGNSRRPSRQVSIAMKELSADDEDAIIKEQVGKILVQDEKAETGKVKMKVYYFYALTMGLCVALLPSLFFAIAQGCQAGSNIWLSQWSSETPVIITNTSAAENATFRAVNSTEGGESFDRIHFLIGYGGFGLGQSLFFYLGSLLIWVGGLRAAKKIHHQLLESILRLPMSFFDTNPSGRVLNRLSKDIDVVDTLLPMLNGAGVSCLAQVITTLIVIMASTPIVTIVILPVMVIYYFIQTLYISTARQIKRIESVAKSPIFSHFGESVQGVSTIRAFKKQDDFVRESQAKIDYAMVAYVANLACNRWLGVRLEFVGNVITFAAALFAVTNRGSIDAGTVGLSITYALNVTVILNWLVRMCSEIEANIVSVERIKEYIEEDREADWSIEKYKPSESWPVQGSVTFHRYETRYRPGLELVVKGISCTIKPGEKVGIVGRTGAGKSSLTLGLFRIIEAAGGLINIDNVDIAKIGLHDLRGRLTIIPQDPVLFSGTLRLNLDPFGSYSDADVWHALELSHLSSYVKSQPNGLQAVIDEGGSNLSVGQRQLVSLARALLRKSRILVLDEATAAVDLDTDDLIQATIRSEFAECTILTIAHRLNTIMDSDRVMVMDKGKIAELDAPSILLADKDSIFYSMARDAGLV